MVDLRVDTTLDTIEVYIENLGTVHLRELSGLERLEMEEAYNAIPDGTANLVRKMAVLIVASVTDASGTPIYKPDDADTIVRNQSYDVLDQLFMAALRLNKMDKDTVETREKNSGPSRAA